MKNPLSSTHWLLDENTSDTFPFHWSPGGYLVRNEESERLNLSTSIFRLKWRMRYGSIWEMNYPNILEEGLDCKIIHLKLLQSGIFLRSMWNVIAPSFRMTPRYWLFVNALSQSNNRKNTVNTLFARHVYTLQLSTFDQFQIWRLANSWCGNTIQYTDTIIGCVFFVWEMDILFIQRKPERSYR